MRDPLKIPRSLLQEGIAKSLSKSRELLLAAEKLVGPCPAIASALFSSAVEEIGKAALLRQGLLDPDRPDPAEISGFFHHPTKLKRIVEENILPKDDLLLVKGAFQADAFQNSAFQVDMVVTDLTTRSRSLWTDFEDGMWLSNPQVDSELLTRNVAAVGEKVEELIRGWCP
jgi:hypothetical protein